MYKIPDAKVPSHLPLTQCKSHHRLFPGRRYSDPLHVFRWKSHRLVGPAKCFLSTNWRRRVLIRARPDALGEVLCERDSFITAVKEMNWWLIWPRRCGGPLGCRALSSWPLSSLKVDCGQAWISRDCSHCASLVIGSSALKSSRKVGSFRFHSLLCWKTEHSTPVRSLFKFSLAFSLLI